MNRVSAVLLTTCLALMGCEEKDKTPPPAPVVDPITSPTPLASVSVTGSAEFGSTVTITGGAEEVTTKADQFTARWRATVKLTANADNTLSVTATDAAGNVSEATQAVVTQAASKATTIKLSFASPAVKAGEQVGLVTRVLDQYGNEMTDAAVTFQVTPALATTFTIPGSSPAVTKDQGVLAQSHQFVAYDLSGVKGSGYTFQIKATSGSASDTQVLSVRPAPAQSFSKLAFAPSGTQVSLKAGEDASYSYEVIDLYGNVTTGPVSAFTNAPGAIVLDDGVSGSGKVTRLTTTGSYSVAFYIAGVGQKGSLAIDVGTAPGAFVDVSASATLASPQTAVKVFARVRDAFGNVILCSTANTADITFAAQGTTAGAVTPSATTCFNGSFEASFTFAAEDNYAITASYQPTGASAAVTGNVFITVLNFDNTPPQVSIKNVTINGAPCDPAARTGAPGCDVTNGDQIEFDAVATDNSALAEVAYSAFFESTQSNRTRTVFIAANVASTTVHFRFGVNSNAIETSQLVAMAIDRAGNIQNSAAVTLFVQFGVIPVGARTVSVVVSGNQINRPQDMAFASNGDLFIINRGNNNVLRVPSGSTTPQIFATGITAEFITHGPSGAGERFWLNDRNNGDVVTYDPAGGGLSVWATLGSGGPARGMSVVGAMPQRGWIDVTSALDADQVRLTQNGTTVSYEYDNNTACTLAPAFCFTGTTGAARATALAAAINANASSVVTATVNSANTSRVMLASKSSGEPVATTATAVISLAKSPIISLIGISAPQLAEGHGPDLYVADDGSNSFARYLTAGGPFATNHGQFGVNAPQWGLASRDIWAAPSDALFDVMTYFVDSNTNQTLRAYETAVTGNGAGTTTATTQRFNLNSTTVAPIIGFNALWDVQLAANGCLLVSDDGNGNIYAVDTRTPTAFTPAVERIARGIPNPRGLTVDAAGNLLIAVDGANAIMKLTPTADPTDCF